MASKAHDAPTALVVYESTFGSTQALARAIAQTLSADLDVRCTEVASAPAVLDPALALLVVAAPTHTFGLSSPSTRQAAASKATAPVVSQGDGIREWLAALAEQSSPPPGCVAAAVDTRLGPRWLPGSAARAARSRLRRLGLQVTVPAESFWVQGTTGPLPDDELQRARAWAARLATQVADTSSQTKEASS